MLKKSVTLILVTPLRVTPLRRLLRLVLLLVSGHSLVSQHQAALCHFPRKMEVCMDELYKCN